MVYSIWLVFLNTLIIGSFVSDVGTYGKKKELKEKICYYSVGYFVKVSIIFLKNIIIYYMLR